MRCPKSSRLSGVGGDHFPSSAATPASSLFPGPPNPAPSLRRSGAPSPLPACSRVVLARPLDCFSPLLHQLLGESSPLPTLQPGSEERELEGKTAQL